MQRLQRGGRINALLTITLLAPLAAAADFPEVEPNDTPASATAVTLACGDSISGTSTGSAVTAPGLISADYFRIRTVEAPPGIYRYRLRNIGNSGPGQTTIRGRAQVGGEIITNSDVVAQDGVEAAGGSTDVVWYGFGRSEEITYRVSGNADTAHGYVATLSCEPVTPVNVPPLLSGPLTITTVGQGHSTDTDFWIYDAMLRPIPRWGNDDANAETGQSTLSATFADGTYYVALSKANFANGEPSNQPGESNRGGGVLESRDAALAGPAAPGVADLTIAFIDALGVHVIPVSGDGQTVVWLTFVSAGTGACCMANDRCAEVSPVQCVQSGGAPGEPGTSCAPNPCAGAPSCRAADANCDGAINNFDIDPFVQGVLSAGDSVAPTPYLAAATQQCWDARVCWGDVNHDSGFNNFDIDPFVQCVLNAPPPGGACP